LGCAGGVRFGCRCVFGSYAIGDIANPILMMLASLVGAGAFVFYIIAEAFPLGGGLGAVFVGASLPLAITVVVTLLALGLIMYATARRRTRATGIEISTIYSEIPPD
jgi:hypothetical protein